ncbi:hypothetical protein ACFLWB_00385 [Chloroflexota bacterium]
MVCACYERTTDWYGGMGGERYVHMEVGHMGQNIHLQTEALGLGMVAIEPLYIMPLGRPD